LIFKTRRKLLSTLILQKPTPPTIFNPVKKKRQFFRVGNTLTFTSISSSEYIVTFAAWHPQKATLIIIFKPVKGKKSTVTDFRSRPWPNVASTKKTFPSIKQKLRKNKLSAFWSQSGAQHHASNRQKFPEATCVNDATWQNVNCGPIRNTAFCRFWCNHP
jgi:hypothetical protein